MALDLTGYKLTFEDEFDSFSRYTGAADSGTWKTWFYFGDRTLNGNGERQYYMDADYKGSSSKPLGVDPFSIRPDPKEADDGVLVIEAKPTDPSVKPHIWGYDYTSGLITTEPTFSQKYGYFEMRAKLPEGKGLWPAFWLLPTDKTWPPEIDALEFFGGANSRGEGGVTKYHWGAIGGKGGWVDVGVDLTKDFHNYGVEWTQSELIYYFDGKEIARAPTPSSANKPMYMLANLAVGGSWVELPTSSTKFPAEPSRSTTSAPTRRTPTRPPTAAATAAAADRRRSRLRLRPRAATWRRRRRRRRRRTRSRTTLRRAPAPTIASTATGATPRPSRAARATTPTASAIRA